MRTELLKDINPLCPCWIILHDGTKYRCDEPVGVSLEISEDINRQSYKFLSAGRPMSVPLCDIEAFENITDPVRRIVL